MKYKTGLIKEVKANQKFDQEQKDIKRRHKISNEDVLVVEKNNFIKFFLNSMGRLAQLIAKICLLVLAVIGLAALLYPEPRVALLQVWQETLLHIYSLF